MKPHGFNINLKYFGFCVNWLLYRKWELSFRVVYRNGLFTTTQIFGLILDINLRIGRT